MFENNFLPFSQSKNECFLALDNLPEGKNGMGWDEQVESLGIILNYSSSFFGFKLTTPIPLNSFHISIFQEDFILQPF